jgi:predicted HTH transcriptional regulator
VLSDKQFSEITVEDIIYLINNKISELKTLEYKRQLPGKDKEEQKTKILQSITSFANTDGGIIIFGMKENDEGEASEIIGIETSTDDDFLYFQNIVKDRIEPRMAPPELKELTINDKKIYLMKIHSSYNKPHFVKNNFVFYGRHSNGKYPLDIEEIKSFFLFSKTMEEQFEQFRIQRIMK